MDLLLNLDLLPIMESPYYNIQNFQNEKLRLDYVEIWSFLPPLWFYVKSYFGQFKRSKSVILVFLEVLNFDFSKFEQLSSPKFTKNSKFRVSKIAINDIFRPFEFTKTGFHVESEWR